jgi:hypothetical protein
MYRFTALSTVERPAQGGSYTDFLSYTKIFNHYKPFDFGVKTAQLFSADPGTFVINKKFTFMTLAQGNVYMLPGGTDDYKWQVVGSTLVRTYITELITSSTQPGKNGEQFKIALDKPWFHEPILLKTENTNLPMMKIIGHPVQRSADSWEYTVELQTGNPEDYIPVAYLQPGRFVIDGGTSVSDELNTKYGGDQMTEMFGLQSFVGNYARKQEFSDKMIRAELAAKRTGSTYGGEQDVTSGYAWFENFDTKKGEQVKVGTYITKLEQRLLDKIEMDREMAMFFGKTQVTQDRDTNKTIKVAPGWLELVRDGHYLPHNGSLTLDDIYEFLMTVFVSRKDFSDRYVRIATGQAGMMLMHKLIAEQAKAFTTIDTQFIMDTDSEFHTNAKQFGAQFTKWLAPGGVIVEVIHDPMKDNPSLFPEMAPGTQFTMESFNMDIFDFGKTNKKATNATRDENLTMVMQDGVESYYTVSNVYDFASGAEKSGGNVYANNKELGIYREMSGSLCIWDVSRCGRIEYVPGI